MEAKYKQFERVLKTMPTRQDATGFSAGKIVGTRKLKALIKSKCFDEYGKPLEVGTRPIKRATRRAMARLAMKMSSHKETVGTYKAQS